MYLKTWQPSVRGSLPIVRAVQIKEVTFVLLFSNLETPRRRYTNNLRVTCVNTAMRSNRDSETDAIKIQRTLISINDISLKIKKELAMIDELVKESGHLRTVVNTTNQTLSKKVQEMGMNVAEIINENERDNRSEPNLQGLITSEIVTEKLLDQMDA